MRYLSVCSGIEAATVAWHGLGWTPVGFSEIEPFPSAVLAHHYPNVPNFGDMTKHEQWPLQPGSIDLLVGGTPCQSFSVAGLRAGLSDPRGGLMLTYLEIARRLRPRYCVWENVPGVLSSGGGRDFGAFLGALGELGYGWAYRVLDAQWCRTHGHPRAVPQRRRRVFVVGCLGDWTRAAQVLFERESVQRDSSSRRAKGQGVASDVEGGARGGCWWDGSDCAGTLTKQNAGGGQRMPDKDNLGAVLQSIGYRWQNDRDGLQQDDAVAAMRASTGSSGFHEMNHPVVVQPVPFRDVSPTLTSRMQGSSGWAPVNEDAHLVGQPVPFTKSKRAQSVTDDETWVDGQVNPTLSLFDQGDTRATTVAVGFNWQNGGGYGNANDGLGITVEGTGPLQRCNTPAVAFQQNQLGEVRCGNIAGTVNTNSNASGRNTPMVAHAAVAFANRTRDGIKMPEIMADGVTPALTNPGGGGRSDAINVAVAFSDTSATLKGGSGERGYPDPSDGNGHSMVGTAMTVRRLTARECERLQAFPDDYTLIPWRKKQAEDCPDGPRYKALGNSMAVNCMAWIGERIAALENNR